MCAYAAHASANKQASKQTSINNHTRCRVLGLLQKSHLYACRGHKRHTLMVPALLHALCLTSGGSQGPQCGPWQGVYTIMVAT